MQKRTRIETMPPLNKGRAKELDNDPSSEMGRKANQTGTRNAKISTAQHAPHNPSLHPFIFDAVLYPNRSLSNKGFMFVMGIVISTNLLLGTYFSLLGAWPVLAFGGLDIFVVWLAFKVSYRQGRLQERVQIDQGQIFISRTLPSGHEMRWQLPTLWTKIEIDPLMADPIGHPFDYGDYGPDTNPTDNPPDNPIDSSIDHESQVMVRSKGQTLILGAFLSPKERVSFGKALQQAVRQAQMTS